MGRRAVRWSVVVVLLGVAVGTGLFARKQRERLRSIESAVGTVTARLDHVVSLVRAVSDAQLRYLMLGLADAHSATVDELITAVAADVQELRGQTHTSGAESRLATIAAAARTVAEVDTRARENLRAGDALMATDLVLSEARAAAATLENEAGALRVAEARALAEDRARVIETAALALGATAALWLIGVLMLVRIPRAAANAAQQPTRETDAISLAVAAPPAPAHVETPARVPASIDLDAVAALCTDIARATTTIALTELLSRASSVLGAPGLIVWMASGDELFAALGVGYDPRIVASLGTIHADADNATAIAWRTGEMRTVEGDMVSRGAIVAPLFGPDGCIGVLAVEVPNGRDADPGTRAVTTMIAAQLATILAAWPTAPQQQQPESSGLLPQSGALASPLHAEAQAQ